MDNIEKYNQFNLINEKENFISYLDVSDLTIKAYRDGINCFIEYLKEHNIKNPTRDDFKAFREELKQNMSTNTINSYLTATRCFFKYLELNEIYENITKDVKSIKTSNIPKKQILTMEQCKSIYESLTDKREKLIFSLAVSTGLRANEIALAKIENIKYYNGEIVLFVKCKKRDDESEYVKLSDQVLKDLKEYIEHRSNGYIFISNSNHNKNNGVTNTTIRRIVKNIFKRNGIDSDYFSCHSLRKTCATLSYMNGSSVYDIQQVLHHKSISTTQRYISQITRDNNNLEKNISNMLFN